MCYVCVGCGKCPTGKLQAAMRQPGRCPKCGKVDAGGNKRCLVCGALLPPQASGPGSPNPRQQSASAGHLSSNLGTRDVSMNE